MTKKMVGLSLSHCIKDIIEGKVLIDNIARIVSGTAARDEEEWTKLVDNYCRDVWHKDPIWARAAVTLLRREGRIEQMRLTRHETMVPSLDAGHWIEQDVQIPIHIW